MLGTVVLGQQPRLPEPLPTAAGRDSTEYRDYVGAFVVHGPAIAAALGSLQDCRTGPSRCEARLVQARVQVDAYRRELDALPAPSCLDAADQRLRDALALLDQGLLRARQGIDGRDGVELVQGVALITAGAWRGAGAVVAASAAKC